MQKEQATIAVSNGNWVLRNSRIRISVSQSTGQITSINNGRELLSSPTELSVIDKTKSNASPMKSTSISQSENKSVNGDVMLSYVMSFGQQDTAKCTLTMSADAFRWDAELSTNSGADREANIIYKLPLLQKFDEIFWAAPGCPQPISGLREQSVEYRTSTYIPWSCVYSRKSDDGLSIIAPPDLQKPGLTFSFDQENHMMMLNLVNHHLRLGTGTTAKCSFIIVAHEGDWRPGLGWLSDKYPIYFEPTSDRVRRGEGWYAIGSPFNTEEEIADASSRGVTWQELHGHFPFYGVYKPDKQQWGIAMDQDAVTIDQWEKGIIPGLAVNSDDNMHKRIALWHKYAVQVYVYYQTFEAWKQYATKYFSQDITRDANGIPCIAWQFCYLMNPDPAFPWGKALQKQIDNMIASYPDFDGIFLDRDDYRDYDFSHSDGISMQDDKPCYMLAFAQEKALVELSSKLHSKDKGIWTNGPTNLEVCKGVDGIMSEAVGQTANLTQFFGLRRPMICLPYDITAQLTESKLKSCLVGGYFPAICDTPLGSLSRKLESKYRPLFDLMKGRKWVLNAHAIEVDSDASANLFLATNGDYLAVVVSESKTQLVDGGSTPTITRDLKASISVPNMAAIKHCYLMSGDYISISELPMVRSGKRISVNIPVHIAASMLVFTSDVKFDVCRQSSPVLVKGTTNVLQVKSTKRGAMTVQTPWGIFNSKNITDGLTNIPIDVPDTVRGEVNFTVSVQNSKLEMSAWIVNPVEITLPSERLFSHDLKSIDTSINVCNYTNTVQTVTIAGTITGKGAVRPTTTKVSLAPFGKKVMKYSITSNTQQSQVSWMLKRQSQASTYTTSIGSITPFAGTDLFHDDFATGNTSRWNKVLGTWEIKNGVAYGSEPICGRYELERLRD